MKSLASCPAPGPVTSSHAEEVIAKSVSSFVWLVAPPANSSCSPPADCGAVSVLETRGSRKSLLYDVKLYSLCSSAPKSLEEVEFLILSIILSPSKKFSRIDSLSFLFGTLAKIPSSISNSFLLMPSSSVMNSDNLASPAVTPRALAIVRKSLSVGAIESAISCLSTIASSNSLSNSSMFPLNLVSSVLAGSPNWASP